jgi:hypothetical protein
MFFDDYIGNTFATILPIDIKTQINNYHNCNSKINNTVRIG